MIELDNLNDDGVVPKLGWLRKSIAADRQ